MSHETARVILRQVLCIFIRGSHTCTEVTAYHYFYQVIFRLNIVQDTCFQNYCVQQIIINSILLCDLCMEFNGIKMTSNTKYV